MKFSDIEEAKETCKTVQISQNTRNRLLNQEVGQGLKRIVGLDIEFSIKLKPQQWIRILEQVHNIYLSVSTGVENKFVERLYNNIAMC